MATGLAGDDGAPTTRHLQHYLARASRGVGLVVVEHAFVEPAGRFSAGQLGMHGDHLVPAHADLVAGIHRAGGKIALQISHAGAAARASLTGTQPVGPSSRRLDREGAEAPRPLSAVDLQELVEAFVRAAERAVAAGYDAIELHGAHGFLLSQFLSPLVNERQDEYGQTLEGRARFPLETVRAVRSRLGPNYPLLYRLGLADYLDPLQGAGLKLEEGLVVAGWLANGGVDVLDISGGLGGARPSTGGAGYFLPWAEATRARLSIPVLVAGGINDPLLADRAIRSGKADLVGVGRGLWADPAWAEKARQMLMGAG
jgi:2,4-dienoyl-CoA reductase-like NADH-dependent reductase (Old Yellow Enzyme family)